MGNFFCFFGFYRVSKQFFKDRVEYEEELLVKFFGKDYENYKKKTSQFFPGWNTFLGISNE